MENDTPIAYHHCSASEFTTDYVENMWDEEHKHNGPKIRWLQFLPDNSVKAFDSNAGHRAGLFSLRMQIMDERKDSELEWVKEDLEKLKSKWDPSSGKPEPAPMKAYFRGYKHWAKAQAKRLHAVKIRAYVIQCRNLPAADAGGSCDPFIHSWDIDSDGDMLKDKHATEQRKRKTCTSVIEDTLNPIYQEVLELNYEVENIKEKDTWPPFILDIYDQDMDFMTTSTDFIGRCVVEPEDMVQVEVEDDNGDKVETEHPTVITQEMFENENFDSEFEMLQKYTPTWFPVRYAPGEPKSGEVLVKFYACELDQKLENPNNFDMSKLITYNDFNI